jgi:tetratricopeptide (TPR) repeat protein
MLISATFNSWSQVEVESMLDEGYEFYEQSQFNKAIAIFSKVISMEPAIPEAYFLRGICKHSIDEVKASIVDMEKAIELDPDYLEAYQQLGYIYLVGQAPKEAIAAFDKALELDPTAAETYVNRGTAKCMQNDATGAREDWKKATELGVKYSEQMICD